MLYVLDYLLSFSPSLSPPSPPPYPTRHPPHGPGPAQGFFLFFPATAVCCVGRRLRFCKDVFMSFRLYKYLFTRLK